VRNIPEEVIRYTIPEMLQSCSKSAFTAKEKQFDWYVILNFVKQLELNMLV